MRLSNRLSNGITQAKLSNSMSNSSSTLRVWAPPTPGAKLFARPQEVYEGGACEEEMKVEAGPQGEVPRGLKRPCAGSFSV